MPFGAVRALASDEEMCCHVPIRRIGGKTGRKAGYGVDIHESDAIEQETGSRQPVSADEAACTEGDPLLVEVEEPGFWPDGWKYGQLIDDVLVCFNWENRHGAGESGGHCGRKRRSTRSSILQNRDEIKNVRLSSSYQTTNIFAIRSRI